MKCKNCNTEMVKDKENYKCEKCKYKFINFE